MEVSGQLHAQIALPLGKELRKPFDRRVGEGLRAGLDTVAKRKILSPCRESNPGHSVPSQALYRQELSPAPFSLIQDVLFLRNNKNGKLCSIFPKSLLVTLCT